MAEHCGPDRLGSGSHPKVQIKTVNLKSDRPSVAQALLRLDREISLARQQKHPLVKIIHGYGSTGAGGDIRIAVQRRLQELAEAAQIRAYVFGEDWSKANDQAWQLLLERPELKSDADLGRRNQGITIVVM